MLSLSGECIPPNRIFQVLSDGANTYVYGYTRLAQVNDAETGYYLTDALGSVRQMTDPGAQITLVRSCFPYGEPTHSLGVFTPDSPRTTFATPQRPHHIPDP